MGLSPSLRLFGHRITALFTLTALSLVLALNARASEPVPDPNPLPDAVVSTLKFQLKNPEKTELSLIFIDADTAEAAFRAYHEATQRLHPTLKDPYAHLDVTAILRKDEDTQILRRFLPKSVVDASSKIVWEDAPTTSRKPSSTNRMVGDGEAPAAGNLSRLDLLKNFESLKKMLPPESFGNLNAAGDALVKAKYQRSPKRFALIALRTLTVGVGSAVPMIFANTHSDIIWSMFANGIYTGLSIQMGLEWLRNQYTYVQGWERKLTDLILRPFGYRWDPTLKTGSGPARASYGASMMKWYGTELAVNEANRLHGYASYQFLVPDARTVVDGVAQVPAAFQLAQGALDGAVIGIHTVATQGVYEKVFNDEYVHRTFPYHVQAAHYTELLKTTTDPSLIQKYQAIIQASIRYGLAERVYAGILANIGTMSWISALSLQGIADPIYSKIASYSLWPVAGGLQLYFNYREKAEQEALGKVSETKKRGLATIARDYCRQTLSDIRAWRDEFKSEIVRIRPAAERAP